MNIKYFAGVTTIEELKKTYRKLSKKFHPDVNPADDAAKIFIEINAEYEFLFGRLGNEKTEKQGHKVDDSFRYVIDKLIKYDELEINIIGSWVWVKGNTYQYKEFLKDLGFRWSSKNKSWYLGEITGKKRRGSLTWAQKVEKYGLEKVKEAKTVTRKRLA